MGDIVNLLENMTRRVFRTLPDISTVSAINYFCKSSILDTWQGSEHAFDDTVGMLHSAASMK